MPQQLSPRRAGFTLIELLVVIAIIAILIAILVPALGAARRYALQGKDSTHIRAIAQGMILWGSQHDGDFPRPSELDIAGNTIDAGNDPGLVKDNTGNILSVLIFNGMLAVEQTISPVENNERIVRDDAYQTDTAGFANNPSLALWDPGFAGFPAESDSFSGVPAQGRRKGEGGQEVGHTSYATAFPFGERASKWSSKFSGTTVIAGNRGPVYQGKPGDWQLHLTLGVNSNTLKFYGDDREWNGHLAYGDGRVEFTKQPDPAGLKLSFGAGSNTSSAGDNVFFNENDNDVNANATGDQDRPGRWANAYLRPWGNVTFAGDIKDPRVTLFRD